MPTLRDLFPTVSNWTDELRRVFGAESINEALRRGEFWARENGTEVGTQLGAGYVPASNGPLKKEK